VGGRDYEEALGRTWEREKTDDSGLRSVKTKNRKKRTKKKTVFEKRECGKRGGKRRRRKMFFWGQLTGKKGVSEGGRVRKGRHEGPSPSQQTLGEHKKASKKRKERVTPNRKESEEKRRAKKSVNSQTNGARHRIRTRQAGGEKKRSRRNTGPIRNSMQ